MDCVEQFLSVQLTDVDTEKLSKLSVPIPQNEDKRIRVLRESAILDTSQSDESYDRFVHICCRVFKVIFC